MLVGTIACGKTTLCQRLNHMALTYRKTQAIEVIHHTIDTPGEYLEHRSLLRSLMVTSAEVEQVLFLLDATQTRYMYSPGQAAAFPVPVAGVVTKVDAASPEQRAQARELLALAGAEPVFELSAVSGEGLEDLLLFLGAPPAEGAEHMDKEPDER